jgi:hypothetical protein
MDPFALAVGAFGAVVTVAAFITAIYVGSQRGVKATSVRLSSEQTALISILQQRVEALGEENKRQAVTIATLQLEVAKLRAELDVEKRISLRLQQLPQEGPAHE